MRRVDREAVTRALKKVRAQDPQRAQQIDAKPSRTSHGSKSLASRAIVVRISASQVGFCRSRAMPTLIPKSMTVVN
jgi:hypothetical protein